MSGCFVQFMGAGIASASWLFLIVIVSIILTVFITPIEERYCLEKYGDAYREYIDKTPRWIGIPKSQLYKERGRNTETNVIH